MRRKTFTAIKKCSSTNEFRTIRYTIGALIGSGVDATCRECFEGTDRIVRAVKIFQNNDKMKMRAKFRRELGILKLLKHKRIVGLLNFAEDVERCYIVMPVCNGGSLETVLRNRRLPEAIIAIVVRQILEGLCYLHSRKVIHRDIKPANLLLHNGDIKIIDFGYAIINEHGRSQTTICGTPNYMAPEILSGSGYEFGVDIWALGITLYRMLFGQTPYGTKSLDETYKLIKTPNSIVYPDGASDTAISFMNLALTREPANRWTATQLLEHPFVNQGK